MNTSNAPYHFDHDNHGPVTNQPHPTVYALLGILVLWTVLMVWNFAGGGGLVAYLLVIISGFLGVIGALALILTRVGYADPGHADAVTRGDAASGNKPPLPLREWASEDFNTGSGRLSGTQAALQILLPIIAAAVGMTAIGIAYHFAAISI